MNPQAVPRLVRTITCLGLGLGALGSTAWADSGTMGCPGTPSAPPDEPWPAPPPPPPPPPPSTGDDGASADAQAAQVKQLLPGTTRKTPGEPLNAKLDGPVIAQFDYPFSFLLADQTLIEGLIHGEVVNEAQAKCAYYFVVKLHPTPHHIKHLIVHRFTHPVHKLFGDYRNDIDPNGFPSRAVARSPGAGDTVTFDFGQGLPGNTDSRALLLATDTDVTHKTGTIQVEADDGTLSPQFPAWVPKLP